MNALIRKEVRQLLPPWAVAMVLAIFPPWLLPLHIGHDDTAQALAMLAYYFGVLLLAMVPFGSEFSQATFSQLLAQPVPRLRLWRTKMGLFLPAAVMVIVAFIISIRLRIAGDSELEKTFVEQAIFMACTGAVFFVSGLWTNLLFRQVMAAFWLTILFPVAMVYGIAGLLTWLTPLTLPLPHWMLFSELSLYLIGSWFLARRMFLQAQDVPWTGWSVSFPVRLGWKSRKLSGVRKIRTPIAALIWKELQLQHVTLIIAAAVVVVHLVLIVIRILNPGTNSLGTRTGILFGVGFVLWITLPLLTGCQAVAEERKLGTLEGFLCLPVTRRRQFAIKLGVVIALSVCFCALVPWLIEGTAVLVGIEESPIKTPFHLKDVAWVSVFIATVAMLAFYGSTLTRNIMQAICAALVVDIVAVVVTIFMNDPIPFVLGDWGGSGPLLRAIGIPVFALVLLWLSFGNYRRVLVDSRVWLRNGLVAVAAIFAVFASSMLIYVRGWEWLMTLEPRHSSPVIAIGRVKPRVRVAADKYFVLLPDGRLWVSGDSEKQFLFNATGDGDTVPLYAQIPLSGHFLAESNWTALENQSTYPVVALRSDGSLWEFEPSNSTNHLEPNLHRVGNDSDWKSIAAAPGFALAIKTNGTLWGWGWNHGNQLGHGPTMFTNGPVQIGNDSDWNAVFASSGTSVGIKRDGTVWKWGKLDVGPYGKRNQVKDLVNPDPVRWNLDGSQLIRVTGSSGYYDFVLRRDGTAWTSLHSQDFPGVLSGNENWNGLTRVGEYSQWVDVDLVGGVLAAVRANGSMVKSDLRPSRLEGILYRTASEHADWIAAAADGYTFSAVALAVDGTLSCWFLPRQNNHLERAWLGPTRGPLWTMNIFDSAQHP